MKKTLKVLLIIILTGFSISFQAQEMKKGIEHKLDMKTLIESDSIVWFGWDFSQSRMNDFSKMSEGDLMVNKYIPAICDRLNNRLPPETIEKQLKKEKFSYDFGSIQKLYKKIDPNEFVIGTQYGFNIEKLKEIVSGYELPQKTGIGLVINIIELNKVERYVTGFVTFFDIQSKEILWTTKMKGKPGSKYGLAMYWLEGVSELYAYFIGDYYTRSIKSSKKELGIQHHNKENHGI